MGKASGTGLLLAGVVVLIGGSLMSHRWADPIVSAPMQSDIVNAPSRSVVMDIWRRFGAKPEEAVVVTRPPDTRPATMQRSAPTIPRDKVSLVRELQSELKRVGCYVGEINGVWSTKLTRQAMKAFIDRINATLPTDEPDSILLTLVRSYPGKVCGEPCPSGQRVAEGDRCVLTAIATQPKKDPAQSHPRLITDWTTRTTVARAPLPGEGAMALAGPRPTGEAPTAPTASAGAPPPPVARKPVASSNRFGPQIFRKFDRLGIN